MRRYAYLKEPIKTNKKDYIYKIMLYQTKKMEYICLCIAKRMPFNVHLTIGIKRLKMSMRIGMILWMKRETHRHSRWFFLCGPRAYLTSGASTRLRPVHLHPTSCYP